MRVATHDGSFHADEVFAIAALTLAEGRVELVRSRDAETIAACDVRVDVGLRADPGSGDFDHHQKGGAGQRPNGIRLASFGLIWQTFGARACGGDAAVAARVDAVLVQPVDAADSGQTLTEALFPGVHAMTVSHAIAAFNPPWDADGDLDAAEDARFEEALRFARGILEREIASATAGARAGGLVRAAIARAQDPRLIEIDRSMPWREAVVTGAPEALFVVYPKGDGWGMQAVPRELGAFANRKDLPEAWAGRSGAELAEVTGVPDARFCHPARFIAVAESHEGILALAQRALAA
jgi:uncharacterized UPF0160 family protein